MVDVGDEKEVGKKKAKHALAREKEIAELYALLETYGGRAFIWRLLEKCSLNTSPVGDWGDMARTAGKIDVGLWVIVELDEANPKAYALMRDEAIERESSK